LNKREKKAYEKAQFDARKKHEFCNDWKKPKEELIINIFKDIPDDKRRKEVQALVQGMCEEFKTR